MGNNSTENNIPITENNPEPVNKTETPEPAPAPPPQAETSTSSNTKKPGSKIKKMVDDLTKQLNDDAIKRKKKEVDDLKNDSNPLRAQQARFELLLLEFGALVNEHFNLTKKLLDSWDNRYNYNGEETSGMKARRELLENSKLSDKQSTEKTLKEDIVEMQEMSSSDLNKPEDVSSEDISKIEPQKINTERNYGDIFKDPQEIESSDIQPSEKKLSDIKKPLFGDSTDENNQINNQNNHLNVLLKPLSKSDTKVILTAPGSTTSSTTVKDQNNDALNKTQDLNEENSDNSIKPS